MTTGATTTGPGALRRGWRRSRWALLVGMLLVAAALITALMIPTGTRGALDPESADPDGSRAMAQILQAHGVDVEKVTRSDQAVAGATAGSTILVLDTTLLGPDQLSRLESSDANLVLVEPDMIALSTLAPQVSPAGTTGALRIEPRCADPDAVAAGESTAGGHLYRAAPPAVICYPDPERSGVGGLVRITSGNRRITVVGQSRALRNDTLATGGNAALMLRLLGDEPVLRWYLPDPAELASSSTAAPTLGELLPGWVRWAVIQLAMTALVTMLWRGRRLGGLVREPLPVIVRSAETQEGRARLYRQAGARDLVSATLRTAGLRRLAHRLGVPAQARPTDVATLAAAVSGRAVTDVQAVLLGPAPRDDAALVRLAKDLDTLEQQTRSAPAAASTRPDTTSARPDTASTDETLQALNQETSKALNQKDGRR